MARKPKGIPVSNPVPMRAGKNGGKLKTGGHNPGVGRPPDEFKRMMREIVSREEAVAKLREVLADTEHPQWMNAYKFAAEQGYGKATQSVEVGSTGGGPLEVTVTFVGTPTGEEADSDG